MLQRHRCRNLQVQRGFLPGDVNDAGAWLRQVNIESSRTSWAWVASAGAASSSVRMYSWLMCCPQALVDRVPFPL